jgi:hypothetical protein
MSRRAWRLRRALLAGCLLAAPLLGGCSKKHATLLYVTVTAHDGLAATSALDVVFTVDGEENLSRRFGGGATLSFPTTFVIQADGRSGPATVGATGFSADENVTGQGSAAVTLVTNEEVDTDLPLNPVDFRINTSTASAVLVPTEHGRQVASTGDGRFVAVWEDSCSSSTRCDIFYRLFDSAGQPVANAATGSSDEASATSGAVYHKPAVAMHASAGSFVVAFMKSVGSGSYEARTRSFLANGKQDGQEQIVSDSATLPSLTPVDIAALPGGGYVVGWIENLDSYHWQIMGRILNAKGIVADAAFQVVSIEKIAVGNPVFALSTGSDGVVFAWRVQGYLYAQWFTTSGTSTQSPITVTKTSGSVGAFDVIPLLYGAAVVWTDKSKTGSDTDIWMRRLYFSTKTNKSAALEEEFTLNTTRSGDQSAPTGAMRPDGSLIVTWASSSSDTADIRGRRVLSIGLPVGDDFQVNTTTDGSQSASSVAPHAKDGFVVLFSDGATGAKTDLRGRLIYPLFETQDGTSGSLCGSSASSVSCSSELSCRGTNVGSRCVQPCSVSKTPCASGGTCTQYADDQTYNCYYYISPK